MSELGWSLYATNSAGQWMLVGRFDRLSDAAQRIGQFEGNPTSGLFLEIHVMPGVPDDEALSLFQYTGLTICYAIRREAMSPPRSHD